MRKIISGYLSKLKFGIIIREFNCIASPSGVNFRVYFISIKPTRNSRDKQFSSMASRGRPLRKRIYLSLRPQLQLLNGNVHRAGKRVADSSAPLLLLMIARAYRTNFRELQKHNCFAARYTNLRVAEEFNSDDAPSRFIRAHTRRDFTLWHFFFKL